MTSMYSGGGFTGGASSDPNIGNAMGMYGGLGGMHAAVAAAAAASDPSSGFGGFISGPYSAGPPGGLVAGAGGAPAAGMLAQVGTAGGGGYVTALAPGGDAGDHQAVRTVFVTGFPQDVRERELHNLLRFLPGYEASQMHYKAGPPQGFALFSTPGWARLAVDTIAQLPFDDDVRLRCEMAHKNMFIKENDPSIKKGSPLPRHHPLAQLHNAPSAAAAFQAAAGMPGGIVGLPVGANIARAGIMGPTSPMGYAPVTNKGDNPPCNTLFIGNLSDNVSEAELASLFCTQPGYKQMKLVRGPKQVSCFVEFDDVVTASTVHSTLQGACLASSDRGGIRIQYSKNPFGRRSSTGTSPPRSEVQAAAGTPSSSLLGEMWAAAAASQAPGAARYAGQM
eukprot:CAMPEP_0202920456 /NCGR_PEP_ID=MMETSP1392-20130828/76866_1 /ASSEMBLY_ACC=CAM_ASM_000868 /TAXON_ID=225041 /ORGANISM="Chlamydomonas chlamydogama, Strain SAG 11-48b" /LENGTH=392 /DNA_ID=CAMNT_0049613953 /DNA_START=522 /DNA_END=1700 /DNA_ORIENTATION=-